MKTIIILNWGIVGLYGILIIYLFVASFNSDPAGEGMLGGFVVLLLLFVGLLVFLNLRDSRVSILSAFVLGGLPLLLIAANLIQESMATAREKKEEKQLASTLPSQPVVVTDSAAATQTVVDFLHWYKANLPLISQINMVDQQPGKNYSVNAKNTERYLTYLRSSEFLTDTYLAEWQTFFKDRQEGFLITPQTEGPPTGFDYDLVMLTQNVDMQMDSLESLKINSVTLRQDQASVEIFLLEDYEFRLIKQYNRWLINEILNLSAE